MLTLEYGIKANLWYRSWLQDVKDRIEAGGLLFILSPFLMVLVVRFLLGDGWQDAGLRLNTKKNGGWYLFTLLSMPIIFLAVTAINVLLGLTAVTVTASEILPLLLAGFAVQLVPRMFFSLTEEWGWRGYLEPRLAQLGMAAGQRHVIVGVLWGIWHFPLILATDYTSVPLPIFLPLFVMGTILLAFINGQMRQASGSVWPVVLMHGIANTLGFAILEGNLIAYNNELLGNIVPGSITITIVYGLIALWMMRRRQTSQALAGGRTAVPQPSKS
jgi:membrane protease YdiL (CAAX protease family)